MPHEWVRVLNAIVQTPNIFVTEIYSQSFFALRRAKTDIFSDSPVPKIKTEDRKKR